MSFSVPEPDELSWRKLKYTFIPRSRDQQLLYVTLLAVLSIAVVMPLATMVFFSFVNNFPVTQGLGFTLEHYAVIFGNMPFLVKVTETSFIYAGGTALLGMAIGILAAIYITKYLGESRLQILMLLPYGIPSVAALVGWILLLGRAGLITKAVESLFHLSNAPWNIYSLWGMVLVEGIHTAPVAFLLVLPALRNIPASMDEASLISGAGRIKTFYRVLLPVIWPTLLSTFIFLFARTLATVSTPSVLGLPSRIFTFGSAIPFVYLSGTQLSYSNALSFSVILTLISGVFIVVYLRVQSQEGKYTTVIGQGSNEPKRYEIGPVKKALGYGLLFGYLIVAGILPLTTIIWDSLLPPTILQLQTNLSLFTVQNYVALFTNQADGVHAWYRILGNTLLLAVTVPTTTMVVGLLIAYLNQTVKMPLGRTLSFLAALPLAIPGIARGIGFLAAFIMTPIYGTFIMLFVAFHGWSVPIAMRYASPALTRIGTENTEASLVSGANVIRSYRRIILPLVSEDFIAGWMHMFVGLVRNVSIPILLYTAGSEVVAVTLLNEIREGYLKSASTIAVVITVLSLVPYLILQYWRIKRQEEAARIPTE